MSTHSTSMFWTLSRSPWDLDVSAEEKNGKMRKMKKKEWRSAFPGVEKGSCHKNCNIARTCADALASFR